MVSSSRVVVGSGKDTIFKKNFKEKKPKWVLYCRLVVRAVKHTFWSDTYEWMGGWV